MFFSFFLSQTQSFPKPQLHLGVFYIRKNISMKNCSYFYLSLCFWGFMMENNSSKSIRFGLFMVFNATFNNISVMSWRLNQSDMSILFYCI